MPQLAMLLLLALALACRYAQAVSLDAVEQANAISVGVFGGNVQQGLRRFRSLIEPFDQLTSPASTQMELYSLSEVDSVVAVRAADDNVIVGPTDVSFVVIDAPILLNEKATTQRIVHSLRSLHQNMSASDPKSLVIATTASLQGSLETLQSCVSKAFDLVALEGTTTSAASLSLLSNRTESIILVLGSEDTDLVSDKARETVRKILQRLSSHQQEQQRLPGQGQDADTDQEHGQGEPSIQSPNRYALSALLSATNTINTNTTISQPLVSAAQASWDEIERGARLRSAVADALREALGRGVSKGDPLTLFRSPAQFRDEAQARVQRGLDVLAAQLGGSGTKTSAAATREYLQRLFSALSPLFEKQAQQLLNGAISQFNAHVAQLQLGPDIMQEMRQWDRTVRQGLARNLTLLRPEPCPLGLWSPQGFLQEFSVRVDDWVSAREAGYRAMGVLPRGWGRAYPPLDVSLHVFLAHPLRLRDHSQDVLGGLDGEDVVFDPALLGEEVDRRAPPQLVRQALLARLQEPQEEAGAGLGAWLAARDAKRRAEWAREMLMLPLSFKQWGVGARSSRGSGKRDPLQKPSAQDGPERFVRWDVAPMPEAQRALALVQQRAASPVPPADPQQQQQEAQGPWRGFWVRVDGLLRRGVEGAADAIPSMHEAHYRHPAYNYGPQYAPSPKRR